MAPPTNNHQALTLDRGLSVLEALAESDQGMTVGEIAIALGIHRQAVYRLLGTLERRNFAAPAGPGRWRLGIGAISLNGAFVPRLQAAARPLLRDLAERGVATAFLTVAEGNETVALAVVEPSQTDFHLAYREGSRHPLNLGAAGVAILATDPPRDDDSEEILEARAKGYAVSYGKVTRGTLGVACQVKIGADALRASVGLIALAEGADLDHIVTCVLEAAPKISENLSTASQRAT